MLELSFFEGKISVTVSTWKSHDFLSVSENLMDFLSLHVRALKYGTSHGSCPSDLPRRIKGILQYNIGKSFNNAQKNLMVSMKIPCEVDFSWSNLVEFEYISPQLSKLYEIFWSCWKDEILLPY